MIATERPNGFSVQPQRQNGYDRGRRGARLPLSTSNKNATPGVPARKNNEELPRAASFTYLPSAKDQSYRAPVITEIKGFPFSDHLTHHANDADNSDLASSSGGTTPEERALPTIPPQVEEVVAHLSSSSPESRDDRVSSSSLQSAAQQSRRSTHSTSITSATITTPVPSQHRPSINKSFSRRFSRQSWYQSNDSTPSRSPSPQKEPIVRSDSVDPENRVPELVSDGRRKSLLTRTLTGKSMKSGKTSKESSKPSEEQAVEKPVKRKGTILRKKAVRAASGITKVDADGVPAQYTLDASGVPPVPVLPKSWSTDRLPTWRTGSSLSVDRAAPVPRLLPPDDMRSKSTLSVTRKKDELWTVFRSLDADFAKFSSKSSALKANVVRSSLIPFLRTYAVHSSNRALRPEDLDRRANILNKWWTGLIEVLHGRNNQSLSGTDRPVILDGISGIMDRPEWRLAPSPFCPRAERRSAISGSGSRSTTSLASSSSDFLADSVHHNVRNIFVQNLSAQMAFVVDKMSLRNASASLVTFCGKACAFAFMFVPGMADILARLWDPQMDLLRRVLQENGIGKFDRMQEFAEDVVANFPPAVQQLGFSTSLMQYMRRLRTPPSLPLGTTHIQWWGHWVERWSGRESDLFYVFIKHFHVLVADFLPSSPTRKERMSAPGMLLVHSQLLANLDATIHREANQAAHDASAPGPSSTFDELLADPDATASTLPIPPTNSLRLMAENRFIMLIRDFLSERMAEHPVARELFALSCNDLLQAAVRGTSMFEHSACYTLLDLSEEALVIIARYEQLRDSDQPILDSDFWQSVCKKMIESENTMTEIRLYAFIYTIWNTVVADTRRRTNLCLKLLLDPDVFESRFNHWCPMVRAYYMRLLCWRVGRHDGDGEISDDEVKVYETMYQRLQETWSHYVFLHEKAKGEASLLPDTSPCHPAPGRRLMVVRVDNQVNTGTSFMSFDGMLKDVPSGMQSPSQIRSSTTPTLLEGLESRPDSSASSTVDSETDSREKGIGGFFRKMMGGTRARSKSQGPPKRQLAPANSLPSAEKIQSLTRSATDEPRRASMVEMSEKKMPARAPQHRNLSFKFSLEFHPSTKQYPPMRLCAPRLPQAAQSALQDRARTAISVGQAVAPRGESVARARYAGRALAEWTIVVGECYSFFERRKSEGAPSNRHVETPTLGIEVFKRPS